jgi:hypothetical protein
MWKKLEEFVETQGNDQYSRTHLLFIDYTNAYGNVVWSELFENLERKAILSLE